MDFYYNEETNRLRRIVNWVVDVIVVIAIAWFTVYAFGTQVMVNGNSMLPLLKSEDVVLMNRIAYDFGDPRRFDIVVFSRENQRTNLKRVIGLPGETVQIKNGMIYINEEPLEAENKLQLVSLAGLAKDPVLLGEDEYFLLGDNRESSEDSRFDNIGNISRDQIMGKAWLRIFPLIDIAYIDAKK